MFKKVLSILIASSLIMSATSITAGAVDEKSNEASVGIKTIRPVIKNNITTYYDQDGNEVDITENNRDIKVNENVLPETFDLRDEGRSTSVKDQGSEGFCWNFASTASMESSVLSNPKLRAELGEKADQVLDLSEIGNTWYIHTSIDDKTSYLYEDYYQDENKGSKGGNDIRVAMGLSSGFGAYPEELMPYSDWGNHFSEALRFYSDYRLKEFVQLDYDVALIKKRLMDYGAIYVSYNCYNSNYNMVDGIEAYYDDGTPLVYDPNNQGHAVSLVGWDDNFSRDNFCEEMRPENDGAWLIKNSWGTGLGSSVEGYEGYFWMSYETAVNGYSQFVVQDAEEFDNIYQHQFALDGSVYISSAANIFTAEKDEVLEQICFANFGSSDVTVEIYKLNENYTSPEDGELLVSFDKIVDFSGTHCVDVPEYVELLAGDTFSVVLKSDEDFFIEYKTEGPNLLENKSFVTFSDNSWIDVEKDVWTDVTTLDDVGYVGIKAYTSNKNGAVYKDELSQLVDEAENLLLGDSVPQEVKSNLGLELENAKQVLNDDTASQNTVDNTYCLLDNVKDEVGNYCYEINNIDDFIDFYNNSIYGKYSDAVINLNTDLDLSELGEIKPLFYKSYFRGVFNGNGHTISNLTVVSDKGGGLFKEINNAEVNGINLENCTFKAERAVGAIAGDAFDSSITDCSLTNIKVTNKMRSAGGILGYVDNVSISGCKVADSTIISNNEYGGGIAGYAEHSSVKGCSVSNTEIIGRNFASTFGYMGMTDDAYENCVSKDNVVKSFIKIMGDDGSKVYISSEYVYANAFIVYNNGKYTLESYLGEITDVKSEEAIVTKSGDKYEVDLNGNTEVYLDLFYEDLDVGYFWYETDFVTNEITLCSYCNYDDETETEIAFPSSIGGLPVTSLDEYFCIETIAPIKSYVFAGTIQNYKLDYLMGLSDSIESVTFGEGFTHIDCRFMSCESLVSVSLPDSLENITSFLFDNCVNLENVRLGKNLKNIGSYAFYGCNNLKSIELPESVETVGEYAFAGCGSLSVVLGKNIKKISENAFGVTGKRGLNYKKITIPDFTVIGYAGTPAEDYATKNGFKFIDVSSQEAEIPEGYFDYSVFLSGDVNLDGVENISDVTLIQNYLVNKAELNQIQEYNAMLGGFCDDISIKNATLIQKRIAGLDWYL